MSTNINTIIETLVKKRAIALGVLGGIVLLSLGAGYWQQNKQSQEKEAAALYDQTWPNVYTVLNELQNAESTPERQAAAASLYQESASNLDTIILDYPNTPSAARAALLVLRVSDEPALKAMLGTQTFESAQENALDPVKKAHPKFWTAALLAAEGLRAEKTNDFASAIGSYEAALESDRPGYISDYLLVSMARNKEILNDSQGALQDYQSLVDQYPDSPWNNFALGKIYLLSQSTVDSNAP